jgi:hypothetical protein
VSVVSVTFHLYCGGELRVTDGTFRCSNCGVTGTVELTPGEIALSDVRTVAQRAPIVTDREIQLLSYESENTRLQQMLQELVELRRAARTTITKYDLYRPHGYNPAIELGGLVNRAGCEWWNCTAHAATQRKRKDRHDEASHLCTAHADEGDVKGLWDEDHPTNQAWRQEDYERRATARKRTVEMIDEGREEHAS